MDRERPEMYRALGRTIHVVRTDRGLDRKSLAERAGISYSYLAAIENGVKPPSSKVLFAIAEALGLRSHELLAAAETRHDRSIPPAARSTSWFHADRPAAPTAAAAAAGPAPEAMSGFAPEPDGMMADALEERADPDDQGDLPMRRSVPRSPAGFLMELERLTIGMSAEDRDLVLDLARRLAAGR